MRLLVIALSLMFVSCTADLVEPKETNITGYWQNTKDEVIDDVQYKFYPVVLNVLQDAKGYTTLVGQITYDSSSPLDISGFGVTDVVTNSFSFSFQTEEMLINGIPTKLSGQMNGNIVGDMLRGHCRINALQLNFVVHLKRTQPIIYLPKLSPHNQGGSF